MFRSIGDAALAANEAYLATQNSRWSYTAAPSGIVNTTTAVTVKTAAGAGIRNFITGFQIMAGTLGAATEVVIRDGAGGTVLWRGWVPATGVNLVVALDTPLFGTAHTLLEVATLTATVTGGVYINIQGYADAH